MREALWSREELRAFGSVPASQRFTAARRTYGGPHGGLHRVPEPWVFSSRGFSTEDPSDLHGGPVGPPRRTCRTATEIYQRRSWQGARKQGIAARPSWTCQMLWMPFVDPLDALDSLNPRVGNSLRCRVFALPLLLVSRSEPYERHRSLGAALECSMASPLYSYRSS